MQIQLFEALGAAVPRLRPSQSSDRRRRRGAFEAHRARLSIASLREKGIEPLAVAALAVLVGSAEAVRPVASLDELAGLVDLTHLSHGAARFDEAELDALSARTLHAMPFAAVADRLARARNRRAGRRSRSGSRCGAIWRALDEAADLAGGGRRRHRADRRGPGVSRARRVAPARRRVGPLDLGASGPRTSRTLTGRKGRDAVPSAAAGADGRESGPEMAALLPLIGRAKALARLSAPSA